MTDSEARPRFYEGQYLDAADLTAAVDYGRTQLARAMLATHRWGISLGLDLTEVAGPNSIVDVFIQPGYAIDGFGRPILVSEPLKLAGAQFAQFDASYVPGSPPLPSILVDVWLAYDEQPAGGPRPGFETCDDTQAFTRLRDTFRIEVGPRAALNTRRDPVQVAGITTDAAQALKAFDASAPLVVDADVPQQTLPVTATSQWLVPLGVVAWQPGAPGTFAKRDATALTRHARSRTYVGAIAGSIEAHGGHVTVHDRAAPYSTDHTGELLWVEGQVRADDDIHLYGGAVGLIANHAEDPVLPMEVARTDDPGAGRADLNLVIGDKTAGANRLVVGPRTAPGSYAGRLVVTDDGKVGVDVGDPKAPLHVVAEGVQIGDSATPTDNFHLQSNTDGGRGLRIYNKDIGTGTHVATFTPDGRVGIGTTSPTVPLHVDPATGIRQGSLHLTGDDRWSSLAFNAHHDAANGAWVFPDTTKPAVTIELDAIDTHPRFEVFATTAGNNQSWQSRLTVAGHTGNVLMGLAGGNLGVGTAAPSARVDVAGDVAVSGNVRLANLLAVGAEQALRVLCGVVDSAAGIRGGTGFTIDHVAGTGRYRIVFAAAFNGQPTLIVSRVYGDPGIDASTGVQPGQTAVVDMISATEGIVATADVNGTLTDGAFTFLAVGMR